MEKSPQIKIEEVVTLYQTTMPKSYGNFLKAIKQKRTQIELNNPTAGLKGTEFIEALVHEIPLDLYNFLEGLLNDETKTYLYSKEGAIWFAKHFPQYRMTKFSKSKTNVRT